MEKTIKLTILALIAVMVVILTAIGIVLFVQFVNSIIPETYRDYYQVPHKNKIAQAVNVGALENKFIHIERVFFGGAGAGGQGAPQIRVDTEDQFISLIPKDERVYVEVTLGQDYYDRFAVLTYWAFIENRAGLIYYSETLWYDADPGDKTEWATFERYDAEQDVYIFHIDRNGTGPFKKEPIGNPYLTAPVRY